MIMRQRPAQACAGVLGDGPPIYQKLRNNYKIRIVLRVEYMATHML
jgi:hypothetical protein